MIFIRNSIINEMNIQKQNSIAKHDDGFFEITFNNKEFETIIKLIRPDKNFLEEYFYKNKRNFLGNLGQIIREATPVFNKYIYRGQGCSSWDLEPSFFRNRNLSQKPKYALDEKKRLLEFLECCDEAMINVPNDSSALRNKLRDLIANHSGLNQSNWLIDDFYQVLGFAQHYGIKTSLLDWSNHPLVGLYFASTTALKLMSEKYDENKNNFMSLWVLNIDNPTELCEEVKLINIPKFNNKNISKQQGCFVITKQFNSEPTKRNEEIYARLNKKFNADFTLLNQVLFKERQDYRLLKINIPYELAIDTFNYCHAMKFNGLNLLDHIEGVKQHIDTLNHIKIIKALN